MDVVAFILSFVLILAGCEFFTNGVEWVGKRFRLSEGAVGSVLAAVGTAMPETLIPLIAVLFIGGEAGQEIGVGAILGAPFMLATLAMFVCGVSVLAFARRRETSTLHINGKLIRRDLKFFLIAYALAAVAAFLPTDFWWFKWIVGLSLLPLYGVYMYITVQRKEGVCEPGDLKCLYVQRAVDRAKGNNVVTDNPDELTESIRKTFYKSEPTTVLIIMQVIMGLLGIIVGANIFVEQINGLAVAIGIPGVILALVLAPIATELPEKFNSLLWIRDGKDTYAIGNITGAMVFQSCIPVTIGIVFTPWHIPLSDPTGLLQGMAIGIALMSGSVLYLRSSHRELHRFGLMLGGALYALFFILVALNA